MFAVLGFLSAGVQLLLTTAWSFILEHAFTWLKGIVVFYLLDTIFGIFILGSWANDLVSFILYMENKGIFPLVTDKGISWLTNIFTFWLSFEVLALIFGGGNSYFDEKHIGGDQRTIDDFNDHRSSIVNGFSKIIRRHTGE